MDIFIYVEKLINKFFNVENLKLINISILPFRKCIFFLYNNVPYNFPKNFMFVVKKGITYLRIGKG